MSFVYIVDKNSLPEVNEPRKARKLLKGAKYGKIQPISLSMRAFWEYNPIVRNKLIMHLDENIELFCKEECYAIQGAIFEVYRQMGCGFLEAVYQECLEKELSVRGIPFASQPTLQLFYRGELLELTYKPDLVCYRQVIVELKAAKGIAPEHRAQMLNYLKATGLKIGLIVNFGHYPKVEIERFAL